MKKYILFAVIFILLFTLFQILNGLFLTLAYSPDLEEAWDRSATLPREIVIIKEEQTSFSFTLISAFFATSVAYFVPKMIKNNPTSN